MSTKNAAFGVTLKAAATASPTVVVPGLKEVSFNGGDRAMIDTTTHDDTVTKSAIPHPLRDLRSLGLTLAYDPADTVHERMRAAHAGKTKEYIDVILPDAGAATYSLSGYYTKWSLPTIGQDGMLEVAVEFMATTAETFAA